MSAGEIDAKLRSGRWRQVYWGVYAIFTGELPRQARLWAAVLYAGPGAMLSHQSAGEVHGLVDPPAAFIHVTVPADRRVTPVLGLVIHTSDQPLRRPEYPGGEIPATLVEDTIIALCESCTSVDDVYGWVTRAFGRRAVNVNEDLLIFSVESRKKLRWRAEIIEAATAGAGGAHSALEFLWDKNVEQAHGLPISRKQVRFRQPDGTVVARDREYAPWGVIVELDGKQSHPGEQAGKDRARDRKAAMSGGQTLRFGWKEVKYESCQSAVELTVVLWQRGCRLLPAPCSPDCALHDLRARWATWAEANPDRRREWAAEQEVQEAAQLAEARRLAARREQALQVRRAAAPRRGRQVPSRRSAGEPVR